jgi:hypothetical protein
MSAADVSITKKYFQVKNGMRSLWDVEFTVKGEVRHALFSTEDEARSYATNHLGYTG